MFLILRKHQLLLWHALAAHHSDAVKKQEQTVKGTLSIVYEYLTSMLQHFRCVLFKYLKSGDQNYSANYISLILSSKKARNLKKSNATLIAMDGNAQGSYTRSSKNEIILFAFIDF